jgi:uncharacterized protein (DUF608 family)
MVNVIAVNPLLVMVSEVKEQSVTSTVGTCRSNGKMNTEKIVTSMIANASVVMKFPELDLIPLNMVFATYTETANANKCLIDYNMIETTLGVRKAHEEDFGPSRNSIPRFSPSIAGYHSSPCTIVFSV